MKKRYSLSLFVILVLLLFITVNTSISQEAETMDLGLIREKAKHSVMVHLMTDSGELIDNSLVNLNVKKGDKIVSSFSKYVIRGTPMEIQVGDGRWDIDVMADELSTQGKDYYASDSIDAATSDVTINLLPAGTLSGTILDSLENRVGSAELKIECLREYGPDKPERTDKFGSFVYYYAPTGECSVSAKYDDSVRSEEIVIEQGKVTYVEIRLNQSIVSHQNNYLVYLGIAVISVISVLFYLKSKTRKEKKIVVQKQTLSQRARDIMATLRDEEKEVINFILSQDGSTTQARIYRKTGIPKTSLSRYVKILEGKGIVRTEMLGKMKKITLTEWFMGKK